MSLLLGCTHKQQAENAQRKKCRNRGARTTTNRPSKGCIKLQLATLDLQPQEYTDATVDIQMTVQTCKCVQNELFLIRRQSHTCWLQGLTHKQQAENAQREQCRNRGAQTTINRPSKGCIKLQLAAFDFQPLEECALL